MLQKYCFLKVLFLILLSLHVDYSNAQTNTKSYCDSLINSAIKAYEKNNHTLSLELLFKARTLAKKNGWYNQEFLALNNIGNNYLRLSESGEAFNYYLEAHTLVLDKMKPEDEIRVLNNIGILYLEDKKYELANEYFEKVYTIAKKNKKMIIAGKAVLNLGSVAVETKDFNLARTYYNEALSLLAERPNSILIVKGGLAECDLAQGNTERARESSQYLLANTKNLEYRNSDIELLLIIARSYLQENKLDLASNYIKKIFDKKPNLETKVKLFQLLTEINIKNKMLNLALQYKDSLFDATVKLNEMRNEKLYENSKIKFELQNYRNQSILNEAKLVNERRAFYYLLLFIAIIVLFALWTIRNLSHKLKQKKMIAERNEQILALELEKEKRESLLLEKQLNETQAISLLQQEKLKNEVELKNRKLSAKALYLSGKNEMIEEILSELSVLPQVSKDDTLVSHMQSLKNQLKADNEWDSFITHFEEVNQGFLNSLQSKHPALTINDIRYLSYIYMSLSTKEIASMLSITQDSCRKRKERVLAKMNLSKDINLYEYLTSL